jgi:hypothetical protein
VRLRIVPYWDGGIPSSKTHEVTFLKKVGGRVYSWQQVLFFQALSTIIAERNRGSWIALGRMAAVQKKKNAGLSGKR